MHIHETEFGADFPVSELYRLAAEQLATRLLQPRDGVVITETDLRRLQVLPRGTSVADLIFNKLAYNTTLQPAVAQKLNAIIYNMDKVRREVTLTPLFTAIEEFRIRVQKEPIISMEETRANAIETLKEINSVLLQGARSKRRVEIDGYHTALLSDFSPTVLTHATLLTQIPIVVFDGQHAYFAIQVPKKIQVVSLQSINLSDALLEKLLMDRSPDTQQILPPEDVFPWVRGAANSQSSKATPHSAPVILVCTDQESTAQIIRLMLASPELLRYYQGISLLQLQVSIDNILQELLNKAFRGKKEVAETSAAVLNTIIAHKFIWLMQQCIAAEQPLVLSVIDTASAFAVSELNHEVMSRYEILTQWLITACPNDSEAIRVSKVKPSVLGKKSPISARETTVTVDVKLKVESNTGILYYRDARNNSTVWQQEVPYKFAGFSQLARLLSPIAPESFYAEDLGQTILTVNTLSATFQSIQTLPDLIRAIAAGDLEDDTFRLIISSRDKPVSFVFDRPPLQLNEEVSHHGFN